MTYLIALLIFVLVYVLVKFVLAKVPPIAELADILAIVSAALVALNYVGAI